MKTVLNTPWPVEKDSRRNRPSTVEIRLGDERKSAVPNSLCNPPVVERRFNDDMNPAVPNSLWRPPVVERRFKEDI